MGDDLDVAFGADTFGQVATQVETSGQGDRSAAE
jgi:hypothetical protein